MKRNEIEEEIIKRIDAELYIDYLCYVPNQKLTEDMLARLKNLDYFNAMYAVLSNAVDPSNEITERMRKRLILLLELIEAYFLHDPFFDNFMTDYWKSDLFRMRCNEEIPLEKRKKENFFEWVNDISTNDKLEEQYYAQRASQYTLFRTIFMQEILSQDRNKNYIFSRCIRHPYMPSIINDWLERFPILFNMEEFSKKIEFVLSSRLKLLNAKLGQDIDFEIAVEDGKFKMHCSKDEIEILQSLDLKESVEDLLSDICQMRKKSGAYGSYQKNIQA